MKVNHKPEPHTTCDICGIWFRYFVCSWYLEGVVFWAFIVWFSLLISNTNVDTVCDTGSRSRGEDLHWPGNNPMVSGCLFRA